MLHPEIIKYLYTFATFFEKAKSAKIKIQGCRVILHVLSFCLDIYGSLLELLVYEMQELFFGLNFVDECKCYIFYFFCF